MMLPRFYLVVDKSEWLARLLPCGVKLVQLRIKDLADDDLRQEIRAAKALCAEHGAQLVINDYWRLAIEEGCDFVHLGQGDLDEADVPAIRRAGLKLGISTHDHAELERALALDPDYIALGPIYPTILKVMTVAPQGLERIGEWKQLVGNKPLVAIGGLTVNRAAGALEAGADCLCVVTDVLLNADPEARVKAWLDVTA
jgi:thiamine-phosphate diphosphorylase